MRRVRIRDKHENNNNKKFNPAVIYIHTVSAHVLYNIMYSYNQNLAWEIK